MGRSSLIAGTAVVLSGLVAAGHGQAATTVPPAADADNAHMYTIGNVVVPPGTPGSLEIVLQGATDGSSVPLVVRNNTDQVAYNVAVEGLARAADGSLVASGSSLEMEPSTLEPGQWAIGYVYFDNDVFDGDESFLFQTSSDAEAGFLGSVPVTVAEATINQGSFSLTAVGVLINDGTEPVQGPVGVTIACFDDAGALLAVEDGYGESDEIAPGGFTSFSADLYDVEACPNAALAASGYDF